MSETNDKHDGELERDGAEVEVGRKEINRLAEEGHIDPVTKMMLLNAVESAYGGPQCKKCGTELREGDISYTWRHEVVCHDCYGQLEGFVNAR